MNKIKQKTYFNILIFSSAVITLFYVGNFYLIETVKNLSLEVVDKKQKIEKLNKQSEQIDSIRAGYKYMQEEMDEVSGLVVNYSDIIDFIIEVENIAEKSEVKLDISVSNKEGEYLNDDLSFVGYNIEAAGDFENLMRFLVYLENLKYLNKVENVRIYYDNKNKTNFADPSKIDSGEIILSINVKVYVRDKDVK